MSCLGKKCAYSILRNMYFLHNSHVLQYHEGGTLAYTSYSEAPEFPKHVTCNWPTHAQEKEPRYSGRPLARNMSCLVCANSAPRSTSGNNFQRHGTVAGFFKCWVAVRALILSYDILVIPGSLRVVYGACKSYILPWARAAKHRVSACNS